MNNRQTQILEIERNTPPLDSRKGFKKLTLSVNIRRLTTDSSGTILNDAAVPVAERKAYPFHLFGEFDRIGGYNIADSVVSGKENTKLFGVYVWGVSTPLFFFSALATINNQFKKGDIYFVYVDDLNAPNYFHFVIVTTDLGGYASTVSQTNDIKLKYHDIKYSWINDAQYALSLINIRSRYNGASNFDGVNPEAYLFTQQNPEVKIIAVKMAATIDKYYCLSSFIAWENPILGLTFNLYE